MIREASAVVLTAAAEAFVQAWRARQGRREPQALAGERSARVRPRRMCRTLVSFDGGRTLELVPRHLRHEVRSAGNLAGYIAVKHMGYWADAFVSGPAAQRVAAPTQAALRALLDLARPGAKGGELHAAALGAGALHASSGAERQRRALYRSVAR